MTSVSRFGAPVRFVTASYSRPAPFVCFRCRFQSFKSSRDSLQTQRRTLRTRSRVERPTSTNQQASLESEWDDTDTPSREERNSQHPLNNLVDHENRSTGARPVAQQKAAILDQDGKQIAQEGEEDEDIEEEVEWEEDDNDIAKTQGYIPATTWHGLKSLKPSDWDGQSQYEGFNSDLRTQEKTDVEWAIHCALVELYTLKQHGHPIDYMYNSYESPMKNLLTAKATTFERGADGLFALKFFDEEKEKAAISSLVPNKPVEIRIADEDSPLEDGDHVDPEPTGFLEAEPKQAPKLSSPPDRSWLGVSLLDPDLKFAVLKRTSQLLGLRIPDPQVGPIQDTSSLLAVLTKKPKPKKLAKELKSDKRLEGLRNLQMYPKRWTADHKDQEVGRAKVIEMELRKRGIPPDGQSRRPSEALEAP